MELLLYGALVLSQIGTATKQFAMKRCGAVATGAYNSICVNLGRAAICTLVSIVIWLFAGAGLTTPTGLLVGLASGIGTAFCLFTWILSAQRVSLTLLEAVITIGSLLLPMVLSPYLFGGESATALQWVGATMIAVSLFLFAGKDTGKKAKSSVLVSLLLLTVCTLGQAAAIITKKLYTYHITDRGLGGVEVFTLISFVGVLLTFCALFLFYALRRRASASTAPLARFPLARVWVYILVAAVGLYVNELFATYASALPAAIYYPVTKVMVVLGCFLLDTLAFRERVTAKKLAGLAILITATVLINL